MPEDDVMDARGELAALELRQELPRVGRQGSRLPAPLGSVHDVDPGSKSSSNVSGGETSSSNVSGLLSGL